MAWVLVSSEDDNMRDAEYALLLAIRACGLTDFKQANFMDTLGAAYAMNGDFDNAVKYQEKAVELAENEQDKKYFGIHLKKFKEGKPYME